MKTLTLRIASQKRSIAVFALRATYTLNNNSKGNNNKNSQQHNCIERAVTIKMYILLAIIKLNCFYHTHGCCYCGSCAAFVFQQFMLLLLLLLPLLHCIELIWVDSEVVQIFRLYVCLSICAVCVCQCVRAAISVLAIITLFPFEAPNARFLH